MASEKITKVQVKVSKIITWEQPKYSGYGYDTYRRYIMTAEDGTVYTWKTTSILAKELKDDEIAGWQVAEENAVVIISATVKGKNEYNGKEQTEIQRVKLHDVLKQMPTKEEIEEQKRKEQLASLKSGDTVYTCTYKQYKEHYSDCETVVGTFKWKNGVSYIDVIVRAGRMKASGVRGQRFAEYLIKDNEGNTRWYKAVNVENAMKKFEKEFPGHEYTTERCFTSRELREMW